MNLPLTRMNQHTRPRYRRAGTALAALCVPALAAAGMLGGITSESAEAATAPTPACTTPTLTHGEEGTQHGPWNVVYDGYGTVHGGGDVVTLSPKVAREPGVTHGGLVATRRHYGPNIDVTATWRTHK